MRLILIVAIGLGLGGLITAYGANAQQITRDGNWWNVQSNSDQITYLIGFIDGLDAGYESARGAVATAAGTIPSCDDKSCGTMIAMNRHDDSEIEKDEHRYDGITVGQLADGLSKIFADYRNRNILVSNAEVVAVEAIHGSADAQISLRLEYFRKHPN